MTVFFIILSVVLLFVPATSLWLSYYFQDRAFKRYEEGLAQVLADYDCDCEEDEL